MVRIPRQVFDATFARLRSCGAGWRECQALWLSSWSEPDAITRVVHPDHSASAVGFRLDDRWLTGFWNELAELSEGVRVQVHTHPGAAYHSSTDDRYPMLSTPGFLSLVIPRFATGPAGFEEAFLAELDSAGAWREVAIARHMEILEC